MEWLVSAPFCEEDDCYDSGGDGNCDDGEELHSGAAGRGAKDCLEVDWQKEEDPIEQGAIEEGGREDDEGSSVVEEAGWCDWFNHEERVFVDDEGCEPKQTDYQRCEYLAG